MHTIICYVRVHSYHAHLSCATSPIKNFLVQHSTRLMVVIDVRVDTFIAVVVGDTIISVEEPDDVDELVDVDVDVELGEGECGAG